MEVVSTNIGNARSVIWQGKEVSTGIFKFPVDEPIFLDTEDVEGDDVIDRRYHGGVDKACYLYSADHYEYWKELFPETKMPWGLFGENLSVKGLHEANLNIGDVLKTGQAVVQITQPRQPCFKLDIRFNTTGLVKKFVDADFPGVYVRILEKGTVKTGDSIVLLDKKVNSLSVQKVFQLLYAGEFDESVRIAINDPYIADSCKKDLVKRWSDYL